MKGAFCINEWLIEEGYLVLKEYPNSVTDLDKCQVDWEKTTAWGWGGYYARIFLNVQGRESHGKIPEADYHRVRDELRSKLANILGPQREVFDNKIFYPEELYKYCNGSKPDLIVYFDNLSWRSAGTIGRKITYLAENDIGPDDSVHAKEGVFVLYSKRMHNDKSLPNKLNDLSIYDVAPIILSIFDKKIPEDMQGKVNEEVRTWMQHRN
jgi:predicted AlkP superfamily phosphohydrolase/phosphomutase